MALTTVLFPDYNNNPQQVPTLPQAPAVAARSVSVALNTDYGFIGTLQNQVASTATAISGAFATPAVVTITIAAPGVVTLATHGFVAGQGVVFTNSGGALPTGITASTTYYVSSLGLATNTFEVSTTYANAIAGTSLTTSGSTTGTNYVQSLFSAPFTPLGGRVFNVNLAGTFSASVQLVRYFNSTLGWQPITAAGTQIYNWTAPASEQAQEDQLGVLYALQCTLYTSGTANYMISQ